jgi:hypothetical protein
MEPKRIDPSVQRIQKVKNDKENLDLHASETSADLLLAAFCAFVKQTAERLSSDARNEIIYQEDIVTDLKTFCDLLHQLIQMDVSDHAPFVQNLAAAWHRLLKDIRTLEILEKKETEFLKRIKSTLNLIRSYPPSSDHPLGFYLEQSPGQQWLPFPLIELLRTLHENAASPLFQWCQKLEKLCKVTGNETS